MEKKQLQELKILSAKIRLNILEMLEKRGYGHLGGSLSIVELMSFEERNQSASGSRQHERCGSIRTEL